MTGKPPVFVPYDSIDPQHQPKIMILKSMISCPVKVHQGIQILYASHTGEDVQVVENGDVEMSQFKDGNHMLF
ncbi:hypothetical protein LXL04_029653 [Taraxacum kok-saghyz]